MGFAVIAGALCWLSLSSVTTVVWAAEGGQSQEKPTDLTELTPEQLIEVEIVSINVLGTHMHLGGQWMLAYRYMFENMDENRDGTRRVSRGKVHEKFDVSPTDMTMQMHMPMLMYAPSDDLTLMAMLPYIRKSMNHVTRDGVRFKERTEGIGDLQINALYTFYSIGKFQHRFIFNPGISFPTGSIHKKDFGPDRAQGKARLEYPMQLGSGTFDLLPGITYLGQTENWAWGAEVVPTVRLGRNSHGYSLGNRYRLSGWEAWKWTDWLSLTGQIDGQIWQNIDGADSRLNPADEPTKKTSIQGGKRIDLLFGITLYASTGILKGHRLAIEAGAPIYQFLDGPQLRTNFLARIGWQWVF